jgi:hypothetical protein
MSDAHTMSTEEQKPQGFMAHVPAVFGILVVLALLMAIWVRPPWGYVAWCIALGIPWLALLAFSWRARSDVLTLAVTLPVVGVVIWLSPGGFLTVVQGYLVSACSAFLLLWLTRRQIQRFVGEKKA